MKLNKILFFFAFLIIIFNGCKKGPTTGNLQFNIVDDIGNPGDDAKVILYGSKNDYNKDINVIATQISDNRGVAYFSGLAPGIYYYYIGRKSDCANNDFSPFSTLNAVSAGTTTTEEATINETGNLAFHNFSADPYDIYINGTYWGTVNGKEDATQDELVGSYSIHVKQVSGFVSHPKEQDFHAVVTDCSIGDVNFPQ